MPECCQNDNVRKGNVKLNHLMYADDGYPGNAEYVQKKSASLYFISEMLKGAHLTNVYLNGVLVKRIDSAKIHWPLSDL